MKWKSLHSVQIFATLDCSLPDSSVHGILQASILEWVAGSHSLLQGIFPTQGSNPGLQNCWWIFTIWVTREAYLNRIRALTEETQSVTWALGPCASIEENAHLWTRKWALSRRHICQSFLASRTVRNTFLLFRSSVLKNLPATQETWLWSLGQEDPLGKGMATHSSILAWRIPWTEEPGRLQSMGSQRVKHDWATNTFTFFTSMVFCYSGLNRLKQAICLTSDPWFSLHFWCCLCPWSENLLLLVWLSVFALSLSPGSSMCCP